MTAAARRGLRRAVLLAPAALFAAFALLVGFGPRRAPAPARPVSALVGRALPAFDLPGLDAAHPGLASADLRRGTVTMVNLFASWCLPCRAEAPRLAALAADGVPVHGIAVDDTPRALARFFGVHGDPFRRVGLDAGGRTMRRLGARGLPETLVVDGAGVVRYHHVGEIRDDDLVRVRDELARAAAPAAR